VSNYTYIDSATTPLNFLASKCHDENEKWWIDLKTGKRIERNKGEMIALMHSELSEALEAVRKDLKDEKLPHRSGEEVELADLLIRVFDYAGAYGLDLDGAVSEKRAYNRTRQDHSLEARLAVNGKKF
jgi:NTP pyrophosphatase (non-canonical NTP hydrolase)